MKTIEFNDIHNVRLTVQHSSSAMEAYRIYVDDKSVKKEIDKVTGSEVPQCLHLSRSQAEMLINALQDLFNDND